MTTHLIASICDQCGLELDEGDLRILALGRFCSYACADTYERAFRDYMQRQGWMDMTQPDLLRSEDK